MNDEKLIWNRVLDSAKQEIKNYEDALIISKAMLQLSADKLKELACYETKAVTEINNKISGMGLRNEINP